MSKNKYTHQQWQERYPEADFFLPEHTETVDRFLADWSKARLGEFVENNTLEHKLGERAFKALLHTPANPSDQVIVVPTGFGVGPNVDSVVQAAIIRESVDPHATLVVAGNTSPVNNFSASEGKALRSGDLGPMSDRVNVVLDGVRQDLPDAKVAVSGASLGAGVAGAMLRRHEGMALPINAATIIEPASIKNRGLWSLGYDFIRSFGDMEEVFHANFPDGWTDGITHEKSSTQDDTERMNEGLTRVAAIGMTLAEMYNLARALGKDRLQYDLEAAPEDVGLVHVWSQGSKISPDYANQTIAEHVSGNPNARSYRLENSLSKHGPTVAFGLQSAAVGKAIDLSRQNRT